jgi:CRISPR-associated protein Csd1
VIIQSLVRYYDILAGDDSVTISRPGYSPAKVTFALVISTDGKLSNIIDLRTDGKKKQPKIFEVPYQKDHSNKVEPHFVCDNSKYVFGVDKMKNDLKKKNTPPKSDEVTILEDKENEAIVTTKRSLECFEQFRIFHHVLLKNTDDTEIKSFLKFLDNWKPELFLENPKIVEFKDEILNGGNFVFDIAGNYLHKNSVVKIAWEENGSSEASGEKTVAQCLVSGKIGPISRLHKKIIGVYGPNAQSSGTSLVSFNDDSFCSYGKEKSYNAPISESVMFKYTTALNHLLERESKNRLQIGDTTTIFWAETDKKKYVNLALCFIDPIEDQAESIGEPQSETKRQDRQTRQLVSDILQKVRSGEHLEEKDLGVDPEKTNFFILGLSPNNARLAVRYWYQDNFGNFIARVARHHLDMEIDRDDRGPQYISVYRLLRETVPQNSSDKASSPLLGGLLMRSILDNTPYPVPMYNAILNRVKVERSINYARAGFIKACLIRLARARANHEEDMITVSLNEESQNVPYRLGRLFAVLEKTQSDTNREMKSTINSKYFSSASTTPAVVFPVLLKLAQHHIAKSDWGFKSNQWIEDVLMGVDAFPTYLNLEEQGMFMLGYYHQRKAFFKKKESSGEKMEDKK